MVEVEKYAELLNTVYKMSSLNKIIHYESALILADIFNRIDPSSKYVLVLKSHFTLDKIINHA